MRKVLNQSYHGLFDLFKLGIGPSSSHTMGPMAAAANFSSGLLQFLAARHNQAALGQIGPGLEVKVRLYGSLALTGKGHFTDRAVLLGLAGHGPETVDPSVLERLPKTVAKSKRLCLAGGKDRLEIKFTPAVDILFLGDKPSSGHPNTVEFVATLGGEAIFSQTWLSVGGGNIEMASSSASPRESWDSAKTPALSGEQTGSEGGGGRPIPYDFGSAAELLQMGRDAGLSIWEIVAANEEAYCGGNRWRGYVKRLQQEFGSCIERGTSSQQKVLPGELKVKRRAPAMYRRLAEKSRLAPAEANQSEPFDPLQALDWVSLWALSVNEENAAGGRVVTAPTNGAAGIIPAVLSYYSHFVEPAVGEKIGDKSVEPAVGEVKGKRSQPFGGQAASGAERFLLTATAIGALYKKNASISAAEMGCQGETGVAASMAAAGLVAAVKGSDAQIENAAEIAMEHSLGLTCDPIAGLVQIPCIERNALGATKAIAAARIALAGEGEHRISLDEVIRTMWETGKDMSSKYKETARGGLAANVVLC